MAIVTEELNFSTKGHTEIIDITKDVEKVVKKSKISDGLVTIFEKGCRVSTSDK